MNLPLASLPCLLFLAAILGGRWAAGSDDAPGSGYEPTSNYEEKNIEGWTVLVNRPFLQGDPDLSSRTLAVLQDHLHWIARVVPEGPLSRLRQIRIWVEREEPHHPCMAYHPDAGWLKRHGMNPEKARCVELAGASNFLDWTLTQPCMVLHELAHGYHHQFLKEGYDNPEIKEAFQKALAEELYQSVLHINGRQEKAYATSNPMEYFAEATEAYFGTNDFFPFVKPELKRQDPRLYELLELFWNTGTASKASAGQGNSRYDGGSSADPKSAR